MYAAVGSDINVSNTNIRMYSLLKVDPYFCSLLKVVVRDLLVVFTTCTYMYV